ncbi:hypothetical protein FRX31_007822, partial [Thalictrum thalictroides]
MFQQKKVQPQQIKLYYQRKKEEDKAVLPAVPAFGLGTEHAFHCITYGRISLNLLTLKWWTLLVILSLVLPHNLFTA